MSRAMVLWMIGFKLVDAIVTHIDCGLCGVPESNQTLVLLSEVLGGYWVAYPYLLFLGLAGLAMVKYVDDYANSGSMLHIMSVIFGIALVSTAPIGGVSHVLYWAGASGIVVLVVVTITGFVGYMFLRSEWR